MKIKYFLRGFGAGIVAAALILCIYYRQKTPEQTNVVQQAKELGMVFPEGTRTPETTVQPEQTKKPEDTSNPKETAEPEQGMQTEPERLSREPQVSPIPERTKKPESTKKPENTSASKTTGQPEETVKPKQKKGTRFTVRDGLLSSSVAREMKDAGIIKSDKALDEYMEKNGYASNIREGTYWIPEGSSYEEIAKIITRKTK